MDKEISTSLRVFALNGPSIDRPCGVGNVGLIEAAVFICEGRRDVPILWYFHDAIQGKTWEDQCAVIAKACGPTQHTIRLMALAWLLYDGWIAYMQKHKQAPVKVEQYLLDGMSADDIRIVLEKEY